MVHPPELVYEIFAYTATEQGHASPGAVRLDTLAGMDYALTTERLVLCPVTADDHPALLAHWTLPDVRRFLFDGAALSAAEVSETIEESARDFAAGGYGIWLIRERGQADLAGTVGLRPLDDAGLEIFYSLAPGSWGRGYATEAARAVLGHALGTLGLPEVLAEVDEGNTASVAVVERLGMVPFAVVPGELGPMTRYRTPSGTA
jgi:[ribosomal protein S5]-alanine N-acetyltransferase